MDLLADPPPEMKDNKVSTNILIKMKSYSLKGITNLRASIIDSLIWNERRMTNNGPKIAQALFIGYVI